MLKKMRIACWVILPTFVLLFSDVHAATSAETFARLPTFSDLEIAPGGQYFAARYNAENRYVVSVFEITESGIRYVFGYSENDSVSVSWFRWANSERLLISVAFTGTRGSRNKVKTEERRLIALHATTGEMTALFPHSSRRIPVQFQDKVVSFLPSDPDHILVQYAKENARKPDVYKIDVTAKARHSKVGHGRTGILSWMADRDGEVRLGRGVRNENTGYLIVREKGAKKWRDLSHRITRDGVSFNAVGFSSEPNILYVTSNHDGDPMGLYTFDIVKDEFGALIHKHAAVDISSVKIDDVTGELLSANFVDDRVETVRFMERPIRKKIEEVHERYPGKRLSTRSISSDGKHAVLVVAGGRDAGTYLLYNGNANRLLRLPAQYPLLESDSLGTTFATEYTARDGLSIPAFVTLPPRYQSLADAAGLPFVIRPHGGPGARDFLQFSYTDQFLVSLGYGVLQMNFRGSTGYGQAFRDAGDREWGQAMQDDVTDGVKWLIEKNYADANRIAIAGGSYGGYVALMGAVKTPDLYRCAISFAGVSDLLDLLRHERSFIAGKYRTRYIGDLWRDRKMLSANSPARRAKEIKVPILLLHGDNDTVVEFDQSKKMAKRLQKYGKEHTFVVLEGGDHHRSLYRNRLRYLQETERFLADCLQ